VDRAGGRKLGLVSSGAEFEHLRGHPIHQKKREEIPVIGVRNGRSRLDAIISGNASATACVLEVDDVARSPQGFS
jgi:hypothetical protein